MKAHATLYLCLFVVAAGFALGGYVLFEDALRKLSGVLG